MLERLLFSELIAWALLACFVIILVINIIARVITFAYSMRIKKHERTP